MEVRNKHMGNIRTAVSHERRDLLKAGVAMAAAPFIAGMASTVLPSNVQAARKNTPGKKNNSPPPSLKMLSILSDPVKSQFQSPLKKSTRKIGKRKFMIRLSARK